ncbi:hypothetical protein GS508_00120 [Rhodococcus hoagii]|nr:hypothetical protein [Prescottella equi]
MQLTRGQNTALQTKTLRFTATSGTPLDVSALVVDTSLQALSSDTFVFYNQPHTHGVRLGEGGVEVDLDAVLPDAHAVLCVVSVDPLAAAGTAFSSVTTSLTDSTGSPVAHFDIDCRAAETAVICWELYRRAGTWKVRAVGQGYADGVAGLITRHGVDVDDPTPELEAASPGEYGPIEPLDPRHVVERFTMIMEDAARTTAALIASAAVRRDPPRSGTHCRSLRSRHPQQPARRRCPCPRTATARHCRRRVLRPLHQRHHPPRHRTARTGPSASAVRRRLDCPRLDHGKRCR